jgi:hypothetical protein
MVVFMARVEFAPDGINYQKIKSGELGKMWDFFTQDVEIRKHLLLNPKAKFRLVNEEAVIGVLAYDKDKKEFLHLEE